MGVRLWGIWNILYKLLMEIDYWCVKKKKKNLCLFLFLIFIVLEVREMLCDYGVKECFWKWIMKK